MTTNDFRGTPGGDPSRRPPMVDVFWNCETCGVEDSIQTRKPKSITVPRFCNSYCEDRQYESQARKMVAQRLNRTLPASELLPSGIFRSIVKYAGLISTAEKKLSNVIVTRVFCPHCETIGEHYRGISDAIRRQGGDHFCSANCAQSSRAKLPAGNVCRNPFKKRFENEVDAIVAAESANEALVKDGEEKMVHYFCGCGQWHFGHTSKAVAEEQAMSARNALMGILKGMLAER